MVTLKIALGKFDELHPNFTVKGKFSHMIYFNV